MPSCFSFCVRGWLAKELKNCAYGPLSRINRWSVVVYFDELYIGPKIEEMVTFLSSSPEMSERENASYVFKLCCLCLGHVVPELPNVSLDTPRRSETEVNFAEFIEPLQNYLLTTGAELRIFSSAESIWSCVELLAELGDKALQPSYDFCARVDFHGRAKIHAYLTKTYKDVRVAANFETGSDVNLSTGRPEQLLLQKKHPAQRPRIDLSKTSKAVAAKTCALKLRLSRLGTSSNAR